MKCINHHDCGNDCKTAEEKEEALCHECLDFEKLKEQQEKHYAELNASMDLIRRAAGLPENLSPHEIAVKVAARLANI